MKKMTEMFPYEADKTRARSAWKRYHRQNSPKIELQLITAIFTGGLVVLLLLLAYGLIGENFDHSPIVGLLILAGVCGLFLFKPIKR